MQTSELEKNKNHLLGDEECIHFRPSPNFKHMKKYLKSKFEESNSSPNQNSDPSTTPNSEEQETVKPQQATSSSMAQKAQPPLPPNTPPSDFLVVLKQEVVDDEYNDRSTNQAQTKTKKENIEKYSERTMCRQFARGMCTRGGTCIYAHEIILSQLPGVYTFCKNFQNSVCNFPKCKFVHATVFEKEHYFRTGFLPPHTLVHLKETNSALGPPTALEGTPAEASAVISNPPPSKLPGMLLRSSNDHAAAVVSCCWNQTHTTRVSPEQTPASPLSVSSLPTCGSSPPDAKPNNEVFGANLASIKRSPPVKRDWRDSMAAQENECIDLMPKKCKLCDLNEFRLRCAKEKLNRAVEMSKVYFKRTTELMRLDARMNNVIDEVLKSKKYSLLNNIQLSENNMRNDSENQTVKNNQINSLLKLFAKYKEMDNSQRNMRTS